MNHEANRLSENERPNDESADKGLASELNLTLDRLKLCSTFHTEDFRQTKVRNIWKTKFYFWVNKETKKAFRKEFGTAYNLYRQLYFLQLLNSRLVSQVTKQMVTEAIAGDYENLSAIIPKFEQEKLVFDIRDITFLKNGKRRVGYRQLSDGEHQLLQVIGSILLMDADGTLFLYDEPETHFNPDWRSKFVQLVSKSIDKGRNQELILTTHSPYIISDCKRENVFVFERRSNGTIKKAGNPIIKTYGTSVSIIADEIFNKSETLSDMALETIEDIKKMPMSTLEEIQAAKEASRVLGNSPEKVLLFRELIFYEDQLGNEDA